MDQEECCHCDLNSFAYDYKLLETENFSIVCDVHPLTEGHLLIIPKAHHSCVGAFPDRIWSEFEELYRLCSKFVGKFYGSCCVFEHGIIGQTVFHSHLHLLPAKLNLLQIIPEGDKFLKPISGISSLRSVYADQGKYLFLSVRNSLKIVDTKLGAPRFFRDRISAALGKPERGNWKAMRSNLDLMKMAVDDNTNCSENWRNYV